MTRSPNEVVVNPTDRSRALALIQELRDPSRTDEESLVPKMLELERLVRCPHVSDLLFHHQPELTDEEVLSKALEYRPFAL